MIIFSILSITKAGSPPFIAKLPIRSNYNSDEFEKIFAQFPEEDRLVQYEILLSAYEGTTRKVNVRDISKAFALLPKKENVSVLGRTFEQINKASSVDKARALSTIISVVSVQEQKKYYKKILKYCTGSYSEDDSFDIEFFVKVLDKELQKEIVYDVISKLRELKNGRDIHLMKKHSLMKY